MENSAKSLISVVSRTGFKSVTHWLKVMGFEYYNLRFIEIIAIFMWFVYYVSTLPDTASITQRFVNGLKPSSSDRFIRDNVLVGFGLKVMPNGRISFIVEGRIRGGATKRITLGQHPALSVAHASGSSS